MKMMHISELHRYGFKYHDVLCKNLKCTTETEVFKDRIISNIINIFMHETNCIYGNLKWNSIEPMHKLSRKSVA